MRLMPRAWKERLQLWLIPWLVFIIVRLLYSTLRIKVHGASHRQKLVDQNTPYLLAIWHENVLFAPILCKGWKVGVMISSSKDGEMITRVVKRFGHSALRGSSTRGGRAALNAMKRHLNQGSPGAITPDGPLGPRHQVKPGILSAAKLTGTPILPWHYECDRQWVLEKTWDRHKIPKPFSTLHLCLGAPIFVDRDLEETAFEPELKRIEAALLENSQRCVALATGQPLDKIDCP